MKAHARGEPKASTTGEPGRTGRRPSAGVHALVSCLATAPSAQSVRPWLSSEPCGSSQRRSKLMKLRKRLVSGFKACCTKAAKATRHALRQMLFAERLQGHGEQAARGHCHRRNSRATRSGTEWIACWNRPVSSVIARKWSSATTATATGARTSGRVDAARGSRADVPRSRRDTARRSAPRSSSGWRHRRDGASPPDAARRSSRAAMAAPVATASPNGTRLPRPSASSSTACQ